MTNTIKCNDVGSETDTNRRAIMKALQYCDVHGTYTVGKVSKSLKNEGLFDNLVLGCQGDGVGSQGSGSYDRWSYWKIGKKEYTICTYSNVVTDKDVVCNDQGTETSSNRQKISTALARCKAENKYKCRDVANQLKSAGLKGCVVIGAQATGVSFAGTGAYDNWSYWRIGSNKYTILSYK